MIYKIAFNIHVESDLNEAFEYYNIQLPGLGNEFLFSVEAAFNLIQKNPLLFQKMYKIKRKINVKRFPYGVFYIVSKDVIAILAVTHLTPNPQIWKLRK